MLWRIGWDTLENRYLMESYIRGCSLGIHGGVLLQQLIRWNKNESSIWVTVIRKVWGCFLSGIVLAVVSPFSFGVSSKPKPQTLVGLPCSGVPTYLDYDWNTTTACTYGTGRIHYDYGDSHRGHARSGTAPTGTHNGNSGRQGTFWALVPTFIS